MSDMFLVSEGLSQPILLHINANKELYISSPTEEMISKTCLKYKISSDENYFYFLNKKYTLIDCYDDCKYVFTRVDTVYQTSCIVTFIRIDQAKYEEMNQVSHRLKVLLDNQNYKNQGKSISINYNFCDTSTLRHYVQMNKWLDDGNDFQKMYSCLTWVNHHIKHTSYIELPKKRDAVTLLKFAEQNENKLNCRGLAIVLCEVCLAAGLYARYITCGPKELETDDHHVVVIVFSSELKKWILLDPSYCLYFCDGDNVPLSLQEFRINVINNLKFKVNEDANYLGHKLDMTTYLKYISHKLYTFSSLINVEIGGDVFYSQNSLYLVPDIEDYKEMNVTSNPEIFWQIPLNLEEKHE